jgi:hypothetical protein
MEINVRIPQNIGLGEAAGVEPSWRLYATLADIPLEPQQPQRNGVKVVVPSLELYAAPAYVRAGDLSVREVVGSYRGVRSVSGLSLADPVPLAAFIGGRGYHAARDAAGTLRAKAESKARPTAALKTVMPASMRPTAKRFYYQALGPRRRRAMLAGELRNEAAGGRRLGSPLYAGLLERVADDVQAQGPSWRLLAERWPACRPVSVRLMGSVHRLVLEGAAPELARFYPSAGGTDRGDAWPAFQETLETHRERLLGLLEAPVQTNEISRCSALLGGFLEVARETGLPLRLLEVGSSAGLLLRWPEYHYVERDQTWGDPDSPARIEGAYTAGRPPFDLSATVVERRGCDAAPLDPGSVEDRLTLMSYVWADETWRFELLRSALDVAQHVPVTVDAADACDWIEEMLAEPAPDVATVVFHSLFIHFLDEKQRARFDGALKAAGRRATKRAPLARLSLEWPSGGGGTELRLSTWPGSTRTLAMTDDRGREIRWNGAGASSNGHVAAAAAGPRVPSL